MPDAAHRPAYYARAECMHSCSLAKQQGALLIMLQGCMLIRCMITIVYSGEAHTCQLLWGIVKHMSAADTISPLKNT